MRWFAVLVLALTLGVMGCSETDGTGGTAGDGGAAGVGGDGGTGGTDLCEGVTCEDDGNECTGDGVCDLADGICNYAPIEDGTACGAGPGVCEKGACVGGMFPCTEQGIRDAIAVGGGPHTFACHVATTVITDAELLIDNDVTLDGQSKLTVSSTRSPGRTFRVSPGVMAALRRFTVFGGTANAGALTIEDCLAAFSGEGDPTILNEGGATLTVIRSQVGTGEVAAGTGIANQRNASLKVEASTISGYQFPCSPSCVGTGLHNEGDAIVSNSTISWNAIGIRNLGALNIVSSSVPEALTGLDNRGTATVGGSILISCSFQVNAPASTGYNIEAHGDTCGFDQPTDRVDVNAEDLKLGDLANNGGSTMTHALGSGSVAIDLIPEAECVDVRGEPLTADQRGAHRPAGDACDVGSFELACLTDQDCDDGVACTWDVCHLGKCDNHTMFCPWCELPLTDYCSAGECPTWDEALAEAIEVCEAAGDWERVGVATGACDGFRYVAVGGDYGGFRQYFASSGEMVALISCTDCNCIPCALGGPDAFCINYGLVIDCLWDPDPKAIVHCQSGP